MKFSIPALLGAPILAASIAVLGCGIELKGFDDLAMKRVEVKPRADAGPSGDGGMEDQYTSGFLPAECQKADTATALSKGSKVKTGIFTATAKLKAKNALVEKMLIDADTDESSADDYPVPLLLYIRVETLGSLQEEPPLTLKGLTCVKDREDEPGRFFDLPVAFYGVGEPAPTDTDFLCPFDDTSVRLYATITNLVIPQSFNPQLAEDALTNIYLWANILNETCLSGELRAIMRAKIGTLELDSLEFNGHFEGGWTRDYCYDETTMFEDGGIGPPKEKTNQEKECLTQGFDDLDPETETTKAFDEWNPTNTERGALPIDPGCDAERAAANK